MTETLAARLRAILEEYRGRVTAGGHPEALPERVLTLVRGAPDEGALPEDLAPIHAAARNYWAMLDSLPEDSPDPLDQEMVLDELIDALYHFYGMR